jgi:hypothetical protein
MLVDRDNRVAPQKWFRVLVLSLPFGMSRSPLIARLMLITGCDYKRADLCVSHVWAGNHNCVLETSNSNLAIQSTESLRRLGFDVALEITVS